MTQIITCIDGSAASDAVRQYGVWAARRLTAPLTFLHVLDERSYPVATDASGNIGLGSREHLLEELAKLDHERAKIALQHGEHMLEAAQQHALAAGVEQVQWRQRHGDLAESVAALQADTRLIVLGLHGEQTSEKPELLGTHIETVIRTASKPVLLTALEYQEPTSVLFAFDGSETAQKGIAMVAQSPLFLGLPIHVVAVSSNPTQELQQQLHAAAKVLAEAGHEVVTKVLAGEVEPTLHGYQAEAGLDMLVMGAYGHSRLRQFLLGSTTTHMLRKSVTPVLVLR
ncbi:universal stress protein [Pseudidiomarina taiwanensis]|uniref:Universal stress protein UspA n=1 Tax=Pseudidiomarina taiwanensis TaxID=337250 RepID=A0A432ZMU5_9GAMM|nr:universal stress protein [Pseudidiomarina taiwanensis]RUO79207.1 universal stress protein UspA [Pseudidiomarina taiwanensis]